MTSKNFTLNTTDQKVLPLLIEGKTQQEIANTVNRSQRRISQIANKEEIKALVEQAQSQLINDNLTNIIDNHRLTIQKANDILSNPKAKKDAINKAKTLLELSDKKEHRIMQAIGIAPSHSQSPVYLSIHAEGDIMINSDVLDVLKRHVTEDILDGEAIDVAE